MNKKMVRLTTSTKNCNSDNHDVNENYDSDHNDNTYKAKPTASNIYTLLLKQGTIIIMATYMTNKHCIFYQISQEYDRIRLIG